MTELKETEQQEESKAITFLKSMPWWQRWLMYAALFPTIFIMVYYVTHRDTSKRPAKEKTKESESSSIDWLLKVAFFVLMVIVILKLLK